jgi:SAM-dependent methyltransferase
MSSYAVFTYPRALAINQARQDHLASLGLPISHKRVLEVGAGIGLHTPFFLDRGCEVLITDGAAANVEEVHRRLPGRPAQVLDVELAESLEHLGHFDIVYCYGLLYHVGDPEAVLQRLSAVSDMILLELICNRDTAESLVLTRDPASLNQSTTGGACRPSREWILSRLRRFWGHGYITQTQPDDPEFPEDWSLPTTGNTRAVFVGSRKPMTNTNLLTAAPAQQPRYQRG